MYNKACDPTILIYPYLRRDKFRIVRLLIYIYLHLRKDKFRIVGLQAQIKLFLVLVVLYVYFAVTRAGLWVYDFY
jgi:hypothetical protein